MKAFLILCSVITLVGCNGLDRLTGTKDKSSDVVSPSAFHVVSCCKDNDGLGNLSWPSFVPAEHAELCEAVRIADTFADGQINGATWLAASVDCERDYKIGSEYYKGHGY